jgi:hypothetical protein
MIIIMDFLRIFVYLGARDANTILATHIIFALHMLFVNILLINLLIALFRYVKLMII